MALHYGTFHSIERSGLNFQTFLVANGTEFTGTSRKGDILARYTQIFENLVSFISVSFDFPPEEVMVCMVLAESIDACAYGIVWGKTEQNTERNALCGSNFSLIFLVAADAPFGELRLYNVAAQYSNIAIFQN